jgi:hypothetical protein
MVRTDQGRDNRDPDRVSLHLGNEVSERRHAYASLTGVGTAATATATAIIGISLCGESLKCRLFSIVLALISLVGANLFSTK